MTHITIRLALIATLGVISLSRAVAQETKPLWLVVGRPGLVEALLPLVEHRREQGFEAVVSRQSIAKALAAAPRRPDFLLLVGDDKPGQDAAAWYLPAKRRPLYRWRRVQPKQFASDAAWGDVDGDLVPDIAVGRIPARTAAEVKLIVEKILAYERRAPTLRDLQLTLWAGSPGYGGVVDRVATSTVLGILKTHAPGWARPWAISADPKHPLCGWPPEQATLFTAQMRQGSLANVLMGHATSDHFFSMNHGGKRIAYTAADAKAALAKGPPTAPLFFFSCDSGNFAGKSRAMAESFLFFPGGPVATVGATTESHPLTNYFSGVCLLKELRSGEKRLGALWLKAQRQARKERNFLMEAMLRDVEGKLEDQINVAHLRRDQLLIYALLGDPATRLPVPEPLKASVKQDGKTWRWTAERPKGATKLHVGFRPANPRASKPPAKPNDPKAATAALKAANANLAFRELPSPEGDKAWIGTVAEHGWLRLVAIGPRSIYAVTVELK